MAATALSPAVLPAIPSVAVLRDGGTYATVQDWQATLNKLAAIAAPISVSYAPKAPPKRGDGPDYTITPLEGRGGRPA
jgi:hypothetical protein